MKMKNNNKVDRLYKTDYVLVDNNYQPVEGLDTCYHLTSVEWLLDEYFMHELEMCVIEDKINTLRKEGELLFATSTLVVSMTRLPKEVQDAYIKFYNDNICMFSEDQLLSKV